MTLSSVESLCRFLKISVGIKAQFSLRQAINSLCVEKGPLTVTGNRKLNPPGTWFWGSSRQFLLALISLRVPRIWLAAIAAAKKEEAKIKAEDEENDRKRLRMAPDSTTKRTLDEVCPQTGEKYNQVLYSANKRRRTEAKDTQGGYISSPAGCKMISSNELFLYQTPQRESAALDDLDSFSISSKHENTWLSKGDFQPKNR